MILVVTLYFVLVAVAAFAPLRWAIIAFLLLSTIDFPGQRSEVGLLNAGKGILLPLYLLWRLRRYSGHRTVVVAPLAWAALVLYASIGAVWSIFPLSALKLVGHMTGSLLIALVFVRASKGGYLSQRILVPVTLGVLSLALLCFAFAPAWTGEAGRFTSFMPAQGFASFLGALFCLSLCAETLRVRVRVAVGAAVVVALIFNGSRIWFLGILISAVLALLISDLRGWIKLCTLGAVIIAAALLVRESGVIVEHLGHEGSSNRIAAALSALYEGDRSSWGLGTLNFRRTIGAAAIERIEDSSLPELILGHGTSNAAVITGSLYRGYSGYGDPNRMLHNEWLRILYEWGIVGFLFWCLFLGSIALFAWEGIRDDPSGNSKPLFAYLPSFLLGLAGENFLAGAGSAMSVGFLMLIGMASIAHRQAYAKSEHRMRLHSAERAFAAAQGFRDGVV